MKKYFSVLLTICVLLSCLCLSALAARTGDVDYDDFVKAADARLILRAAVGLDKFDGTKTLIGDIDFDGKLSAADARLALRCAVGLEDGPEKAYLNEYEAFIDGHFSADMIETADGESQKMTIAMTTDTLFTTMELEEFEGFRGSVLVNDDGVFLIFDEEKAYIKISNELLEMLEFSKEDFTEFSSAMSEYKPLSEAKETSRKSFNGIPCTVYSFINGTARSDVYMNGKKLVAIVESDSSGTLETVFENFSVYVSSDYTSVPAGYSEELL